MDSRHGSLRAGAERFAFHIKDPVGERVGDHRFGFLGREVKGEHAQRARTYGRTDDAGPRPDEAKRAAPAGAMPQPAAPAAGPCEL